MRPYGAKDMHSMDFCQKKDTQFSGIGVTYDSQLEPFCRKNTMSLSEMVTR